MFVHSQLIPLHRRNGGRSSLDDQSGSLQTPSARGWPEGVHMCTMQFVAISCNNKLTLMQAGEKLRTAYVRGGLASLSLMLTSAFVVVRRCLMC